MNDRSGSAAGILAAWPAEARLLIDLTRARDDPALARAVDGLGTDAKIDWPRLIRLAARHRVESLVALTLNRHGLDVMPVRARADLMDRLRDWSTRTLLLTRATVNAIGALERAGIAALLLKGPSVAGRYYTELNERDSIDTDILVARRDIERARATVEALGYEAYHPAFRPPPGCEEIYHDLVNDISYRHPGTGVQLELHWRLFTNPCLLPWDLEAMPRGATKMALADAEIDVLRPGALAVYLCCHGAKHAWSRLNWLADIYRLIGALNDDDIAEMRALAIESGTQRAVAIGLKLVTEVYGLQPRAEFARFLADAPVGDTLIGYLLARLGSPDEHGAVRIGDIPGILSNYRYQATLKPGFAYKKWTLINMLCDVRCIEQLRLGREWLPLYLILCPVMAMFRVAGRSFTDRQTRRS